MAFVAQKGTVDNENGMYISEMLDERGLNVFNTMRQLLEEMDKL